MYLANEKRLKVYLLGASVVVNQAARAKINEIYPGIKVNGNGAIEVNREGYSVIDSDKKEYIGIIRDIDDFRPDLLFVALGAPKQEKWIYNNLENLNIGGAMVIGGALDFFTGQAILPPGWVAGAGLEWLWRAILEPRRVKRIFNATVMFPILVAQEKLVRLRHQL